MLKSPWFWFFVLLVIFAPAAITGFVTAVVPLIGTFFHNLGSVASSAHH